MTYSEWQKKYGKKIADNKTSATNSAKEIAEKAEKWHKKYNPPKSVSAPTKTTLKTVADATGGVFAGSSPEKKLADAKTALTGINGISRDSVVKANPTTYVNNTGRVLTRNDGGTAESRTAEAKQRLEAAKEANEKRQKENERLLAIDIDAKKYEIEQLKAERKSLQEKYRTTDRRERNSAQMSDNLHRINLRIDNITDEIAMAEKARRESSYTTLSSNADYAEKSKSTANLFASADSGDALVALVRGNDQEKAEVLHDYINGADYAKEAIAKKDRTQSKYGDRYRKYSLMTNDEVSRYNYLYNTEGYEAATEYLSDIEGTLNARLGQQNANEMNDVQRAAFGVEAGRDNFMSGIQQYFTDEVKPVSVTQTTGQAAREHLGKAGQFAYDFAQLAGNMAPSILLSAVTGSVGAALGSVSMGASAAGNAYAEMMRETGNRNKARTYAGLVGASEAALSYALSGIGKLGGKAINATKLAKNIAAIDNIWARTAAQFAKSGISEGFEETLQEYLEPLFYSSIYGGDYEAPEVKDALRTFALAALSGGVFEGPSIVAGAVADSANQTAFVNDILEAVYKSDEGMLDRLISDSVAGNNGKKAQKIATTLQEKIADGKEVSGADIRKLATPAAKHNKNRVTAESLEKNKAATASMLDSYIAKHRDSRKPKTGLETAKQEMERKTEGVRRADADTMLKNPYAVEALKEYGYDPAAKDKVASVRAAIKKMATENVTGEMAVDSAIARYTKEVAADSVSVKVEPTEATADTAKANVPTEAKFEPNMNTEENTEVIDNAEGNLYLRYGSERNDGADSSVQLRKLEESAGRDSIREETADRPADEGAASLAYTEKVKVSSFVKGGLDNEVRQVKSGDTQFTKEAKRIADKYGLKLVLFSDDNLKLVRKDKDGNDRLVEAMGMIENGTMYVRVDHPDFDARQLAMHEAAHDMINNGEIDVNKIRDRINEMFDPAEIEQIVDSYIEAHAGSNMTAEEAWVEIVCDAIGGMNVFFTYNIEGKAPAVLEATQKIATETRKEKQRGPPTESAKAEFAYASKNAKTADKLSLKTAKDLIALGADSEIVRKETGWFKGMDGEWRFEIDDSKMRYYPAGDARFTKDHAEYAEYQDLMNKFLNGEITEAEHSRMMELKDMWGNERSRLRERVTKGNATLENMIVHDGLFAAYPQLKDVKVKFAELKSGEKGSYNPETNTITINTNNKNVEDTLIHEIQHAVQAIEGLSPGTNVKPVSEDVKNRLYVLKEEQKKVSADLEAIYKEIGFEEYSDSLMDKVWNEEITMEEAEKLEEEFLAEKSRKGYLLYGYEKQLRNMVADAIREESAPYEEYRNTAGEIEARDVANRRKLSSEERKNTRPDVDREDVVFAKRGGDSYDINDTGDGIKYVLMNKNLFLDKEGKEMTAADAYRSIIGKSLTLEDGDTITFIKNLPTVKLYKELFKKLPGYEPGIDIRAVNEKANRNILEIVRASSIQERNEKQIHDHPGVVDFDRRSVYLFDGENAYRMELCIANLTDGAKIAYVKRYVEYASPEIAKKIKSAETSGKTQLNLRSMDSITHSSEKSIGNLQKTDFSEEISEIQDLREENKRLRKQLAHWRNEVKVTEKPTVRREDTDKLARRLIKDYNITMSRNEVLDSVYSIANLLAKNEDMTWDAVRRFVEPLARKMIESAEVLNDSDWKSYKDMRDYLGKHKFVLSPEDASSIADFAAWKKLNRKYFGGIEIGKTNVDKIYSEMSNLWPEFFDEQRESNPADQMLTIVETMDKLKPVYENPYDFNISAATEYLADDIMDSIISPDIRRVKTYADRANEKLQRAKQKRIDDLRKRSQSANARAVRDKIIRHSAKLYNDLGTIRKDRNIPEHLRAPVAAVLEAINFESKNTVVKNENGKRVIAPKGVEGDPTKRTQKFEALKEVYETLAERVELVVDINVFDPKSGKGTLQEVIKMRDKRLDDMNVQELQKVWDVVKSMETAITNWNKAFRAAKDESISDQAHALAYENANKNYKKQFSIGGKVLELLEVDNLTPEAFFHRLGKKGDELFRMLRNAQDDSIRVLAETAKFTSALVNNQDVRKLSRVVYSVRLGGKNVKMTAAQLMELYALAGREQALMHILAGGIRLDAQDVGKVTKLSTEGVITGITTEELNEAFKKLSTDQKDIVIALQKYASSKLSEYGNKATMEVYGVKKFTEEVYWPIRTHSNDIVQEQAQTENKIESVENFGMSKATKPDAKTSVKIGSAFETFADHTVQMATYYGYLAALIDLNRIRNYKVGDGTVKDIISRVVGRGNQGAKYLGKLMADISSGAYKGDSDIDLLSKIVGNYKAASVSANLRVVFQQPTAGLRAMSMIDAKYFVGADNPIKGFKEAKKYAPIAQWKDWGYFETNTGRQVMDIMFNTDSTLDKVKNKGMWAAGAADSLTWGIIWNACVRETKAKNPDIKDGTALYKKAAERFNDIVNRTQVVDGVLQRSHSMRAPGLHTKLATAFMAEPTKTVNMFTSALYDLRNAKNTAAKKAAGKQMIRTAMTLAITGIVNATIGTSIIDTIRDDDDEQTYWEKYLESLVGITGDEKKFGDYLKSVAKGNLAGQFNPLSMLPFVKDAWSMLQGYEAKSLDEAAISNLINAVNNLAKSIAGTGKKTTLESVLGVADAAAALAGIPVKNVRRAVVSMARMCVSNDPVSQYHFNKTFYVPKENTGKFYDIAYEAYTTDEDAYNTIKKDLIKNGFSEDDIESAMRTRTKKVFDNDAYAAQKFGGNTKLKSELTSIAKDGKLENILPDTTSPYITWKDEDDKEYSVTLNESQYKTMQSAIVDRSYGILDELTKNSKWNTLTDEQKKSAVSDAYQVARAYGKQKVSDYEASTNWVMVALENAEYADSIIAFNILKRNYDKDKNESLKQAELKQAIKNLGTSRAERSALWDAASSDKDWKKRNPYD